MIIILIKVDCAKPVKCRQVFLGNCMNYIELYTPLKLSHLALVTVSICLFILRGGALVVGTKGFTQKWIKIAPHLIDTALLLTGVGLTLIIAQYPISHHWLSVKMTLLLGYIFFGMKAMKSTQPRQQKIYFIAALCCVFLIVSVARTHHPLGIFSLL